MFCCGFCHCYIDVTKYLDITESSVVKETNTTGGLTYWKTSDHVSILITKLFNSITIISLFKLLSILSTYKPITNKIGSSPNHEFCFQGNLHNFGNKTTHTEWSLIRLLRSWRNAEIPQGEANSAPVQRCESTVTAHHLEHEAPCTSWAPASPAPNLSQHQTTSTKSGCALQQLSSAPAAGQGSTNEQQQRWDQQRSFNRTCNHRKSNSALNLCRRLQIWNRHNFRNKMLQKEA